MTPCRPRPKRRTPRRPTAKTRRSPRTARPELKAKPIPNAKATSERRCIATGVVGSPDGMVRFALSPDGVVAPDVAAKAPGRGAWTLAQRDAILTAAHKGLFARGFKAAARLPAPLDPDGFVDLVADRLEARLAAALGLARRAGEATFGIDDITRGLSRRPYGVVISATDAGDRGRRALIAMCEAAKAPHVVALASSVISGAVGAGGVKHIAIVAGGRADRIACDARRLAGVIGKTPDANPDDSA